MKFIWLKYSEFQIFVTAIFSKFDLFFIFNLDHSDWVFLKFQDDSKKS